MNLRDLAERRKAVRRYEDMQKCRDMLVCPITFQEKGSIWKSLNEARKDISRNRKLNLLILFFSVVNFITSFYIGG